MTHHVVHYPPKRFFSERYRSSGRDNLVIWFAPFGLLYVVAVLLLGLPHPHAILAGGATVAVLSAVTHDMTHIGGSALWRWRPLRSIAVRHHAHHFKMGRNFGVLVSWWDRLFRTRRDLSSESSSRYYNR